MALDGDGGDWLSAGVGLERGWPVGAGVTVGLGVEGQAFTVEGAVPYRAAAGELAPRLSWSSGAIELFVEGRGGVGRSTVEVAVADREPDGDGGPPGPPDGPGPGDGGVVAEERTTDLWRAGAEGGLRVALEGARLELRAGSWDAASGTYRRAGMELRGGDGAGLSWGADLGWWDTPGGDEVVGGVVLRVPVGGGWSVRARGGRAAPDPLLGSRAGAAGGLSLVRELARLGGAGGGATLYRVLDDGERPRVEFVLRAPEAREVTLLGDFTGWEPVPMHRDGGRWRARLRVRSGVHHFGFRVDGGWHVPEDAPGRLDDEWGRVNATLVVPR